MGLEMPKRPVFLLSMGNPNSIQTWSGIPYHEIKFGKKLGVIDSGFSICDGGYKEKSRRVIWNVFQVAQLRRVGGFQYTEHIARGMIIPRTAMGPMHLINTFQIFPERFLTESVQRQVVLWYHIDQTLAQLFSGYTPTNRIDPENRKKFILKERAGYEKAARIMVHSRWAAKSVIEDYEIAESKVHVVTPGANLLSENTVSNNSSAKIAGTSTQMWTNVSCCNNLETLRLVFVGRQFHRKGLDRLIRGVEHAVFLGGSFCLNVIGLGPLDVPSRFRDKKFLNWHGVIDKHNDLEMFSRIVSSCDIGCLLSRVEAGGIGLREFHYLGLGVLATDVGGVADHVLEKGSVLLNSDCTCETIGESLFELFRAPELVGHMKKVSRSSRFDVSWDSSLKKIENVIDSYELQCSSVTPSN